MDFSGGLIFLNFRRPMNPIRAASRMKAPATIRNDHARPRPRLWIPYAAAKLSIGIVKRSSTPAAMNAALPIAPRLTSWRTSAFARAISSCTSADISAVAAATNCPMLRSALPT